MVCALVIPYPVVCFVCLLLQLPMQPLSHSSWLAKLLHHRPSPCKLLVSQQWLHRVEVPDTTREHLCVCVCLCACVCLCVCTDLSSVCARGGTGRLGSVPSYLNISPFLVEYLNTSASVDCTLFPIVTHTLLSRVLCRSGYLTSWQVHAMKGICHCRNIAALSLHTRTKPKVLFIGIYVLVGAPRMTQSHRPLARGHPLQDRLQ